MQGFSPHGAEKIFNKCSFIPVFQKLSTANVAWLYIPLKFPTGKQFIGALSLSELCLFYPKTLY